MRLFSLTQSETLQKQLTALCHLSQRNRLHHAWIFHETDTALSEAFMRELTGFVLGINLEAQQLAALSHPDFLLIDSTAGLTTKISVDDMRQMRGFAYKSPLQASCKVCVIKEAHTMTVQAQNALLKTLESPPSAVYIFLLTPHPSQLLPTIRSRCQVQKIPLLTSEELRAVLSSNSIYVELDSVQQTSLDYLAEGRLDKAETLLQFEGYALFCELLSAVKSIILAREYAPAFLIVNKVIAAKDESRLSLLKAQLIQILAGLKADHLGELPPGLTELFEPLKEKTSLTAIAQCYLTISRLYDQATDLMLDQKQTLMNCLKELELVSSKHDG